MRPPTVPREETGPAKEPQVLSVGFSMKKGFTLIEILIVVAIIAILSSVVLVGLGPTQRIGRDARRLSDLRNTQTGLELYFGKCGYYPGTAQSGSQCSPYSPISSWTELRNSLIFSGIGVLQVPNDPTSGREYLYGASPGGTSYVLGAALEEPTNPALREDIDGSLHGVFCGDPVSDTVYCLTL